MKVITIIYAKDHKNRYCKVVEYTDRYDIPQRFQIVADKDGGGQLYWWNGNEWIELTPQYSYNPQDFDEYIKRLMDICFFNKKKGD